MPMYSTFFNTSSYAFRPTIPLTDKNKTLVIPQINALDGVSIFAITPTYDRLTQKADLTSLCYTVESVPNFIWIVVEDSDNKSSLVSSLLSRCKVSVFYVYSNHNLHVPKVS